MSMRLTHRLRLGRRRRAGSLHDVCDRLRASHPLLADLTDEQLVTGSVSLAREYNAACMTTEDAVAAMKTLAAALDSTSRRAA